MMADDVRAAGSRVPPQGKSLDQIKAALGYDFPALSPEVEELELRRHYAEKGAASCVPQPDTRLYLVTKLHDGQWLAVKFTAGEAVFRSTYAEAESWLRAAVVAAQEHKS